MLLHNSLVHLLSNESSIKIIGSTTAKWPSKKQRIKLAPTKEPSREKMPGTWKASSQLPFNVLWSFLRRKGHQPGSQHCPLTIMGLPCTNLHLGMLSLLDMGGHFRIHLLIAAAATHSVLSMLCLAKQEGFRL